GLRLCWSSCPRTRRDMTIQQRLESSQRYRFLNHAEKIDAIRSCHCFDRCEQWAAESARDNDGIAKAAGGHVADEFHPVHGRHLEVADNDVDLGIERSQKLQ